ncbi:MAG: glycosyltransferase [Patescibacteria group bacterium]
MRIGIDISQLAYENTGVEQYLAKLVQNLIQVDRENEYVLFFSSLRKTIQNSKFKIQNYNSKVKIKEFRLPPMLLDLLWNRLHILPIEWFVGDVDVFITSDWTEPPTKRAKKITILYDLIVYKYPEETDRRIVETQKRKLQWAFKECSKFLCISKSTKEDAMEILKIPSEKLSVVYPGGVL